MLIRKPPPIFLQISYKTITDYQATCITKVSLVQTAMYRGTLKPKTHLSSATQRSAAQRSATQRSKSVSNSHCSSVLLPQQAAAKFYRQKGRIVFKIVFLKITSMWPKKSLDLSIDSRSDWASEFAAATCCR